MQLLFILLLLPFSLFASQILSYNIYDRTDRVDVMITFDTPYQGLIKQNIKDSKIIIKLENAEIESSKIKKLSSHFLTYLSITPMSGYTQVVASVPSGIIFKASKTTDSYGLRLRFKKKNTLTSSQQIAKKQITSIQNTPNFSALETKKENINISQSYYIVIAVLIVGIIILLIIKKKLSSQQKNPQQIKSWTFQKEITPNIKEKVTQNKINETPLSQVSIEFQKNINATTNIIMLRFQHQNYLLLLSNTTSILLDKFTEDLPNTQEDFENMLQTKYQELDQYIEKEAFNVSQEEEQILKEPFKAYQERAASLGYTQNIN